MKILLGDLVLLRPIDYNQDLEMWYQVCQDPKMHLWVGNSLPEDLETFKRDIQAVYPKGMMIWMMIEKATGKMIGMMRLSHPQKEPEGMVSGDSQRLHSDYWRKGFMKEARKLIYGHAFNDLGIDVLYADVWEGNDNSARSLESVGYLLVETRIEYFKKYDRYQNKLYYRLDRLQWQKKDAL